MNIRNKLDLSTCSNKELEDYVRNKLGSNTFRFFQGCDNRGIIGLFEEDFHGNRAVIHYYDKQIMSAIINKAYYQKYYKYYWCAASCFHRKSDYPFYYRNVHDKNDSTVKIIMDLIIMTNK